MNSSKTSHTQHASNFWKDVLLFPVKFVLRVVELALFVLLAVILSLIILSVSRSSQTMTLADAHGLTYNEFIQERINSLGPYTSRIDEATLIAWPILKSALISFPATVSNLAPKIGIKDYFPNKPGYSYIEDTKQKSWSELPNLYWETFERASWQYLAYDYLNMPHPAGISD